MEPKVSVIIPVYNTEPWLRQCLDSVANQTLKEVEIICVNDGSSDNSGAILDEYSQNDNRFKVIHKNNGGPVSARRAGLKVAKAKYISYVDSDDWIEPDMLENNYKTAIETNSDVVIDRGKFVGDGITIYITQTSIRAGTYQDNELATEVFGKMMHSDNGNLGIQGSLFAKLFKRSLIVKYESMVDARITIHEDWACTYLYLAHTKTVTITDNIYYHYRRSHSTSSTKRNHDNHLLNLHFLYKTLKSGFIETSNSVLLLNGLNKLMGRALFYGLQFLIGLDGYRYSFGLLFPFQEVKKGCRLLLYGAGEVGSIYYRQLITTEYCSEVLWVDRNWKVISDKGLPVKNPEELDKYEFDAAVIAILEEDRSNDIREYLLGKGIAKEKIIWRNPIISALD